MIRFRKAIRHWLSVEASVGVPQGYWEECLNLTQGRGPIQLICALLADAGVDHCLEDIIMRIFRDCVGAHEIS